MEMQGQPNPDYLFAHNTNNYYTNNHEILASSHGAFNYPSSPATPTPAPVPSDGIRHGRAHSDGEDLLSSLLDLENLGRNNEENRGRVCLMDLENLGRKNENRKDDFLSSLLDLENLGRNDEENGGGVCLMDQEGGSGYELQNHNDGNNRLLEEGGGGYGGGGKLGNQGDAGIGKSFLSGGPRKDRSNEKKKRGPHCYDLDHVWAVDPAHAKRLTEGRIYMARSREKKVRYLSELEEKAHFLAFEATNLSAKLTTCQRDKKDLTTENTELKILLEVKQQQAELRDALSETLKQEVEKLKISNGGTKTPPESFILEAQPNSPLASLSTLQSPMHYKLLSSPSTMQQPLQSMPLTSPSSLQSPLQSSPFTSASSPHFVSCSPVASPSPSTFTSISYNPAASPSIQTRNNVFPLPKMSSAVLSQLSPLHKSGSSLLSRRGRPPNLPTTPRP